MLIDQSNLLKMLDFLEIYKKTTNTTESAVSLRQNGGWFCHSWHEIIKLFVFSLRARSECLGANFKYSEI